MKKILLFQMNGIAYDSTRFFSSCLGKALENAGIADDERFGGFMRTVV